MLRTPYSAGWNAPAALRALKEMVANWRGPGTLVLVTNGLTIRAMTGIVPSQAEIVVFEASPGQRGRRPPGGADRGAELAGCKNPPRP